MRKATIVVGIVAVACLCLPASAQYFSEDFESYAAGAALHGAGGWIGWDNVATAGAPVSSAYAYSGTKAVEILGTSDLVHEFTPDGGKWEFTAMQYIPSGKSGITYFILMNQYGSGRDWSAQTQYDLATGVITPWHGSTNSGLKVIFDQWIKIRWLIDLTANTFEEYYNGVLIAAGQWDDNNHTTLEAVDLYGNGAASVYYDDIRLSAFIEPTPADGATDVSRTTQLAWKGGDTTAQNDVYFGVSYEDVAAATVANPLGVLVSAGQDEESFDPGLLDIGQTYFWRVDKVGDETVPGAIWQFTTEPFSYAIAAANISATASSMLTAEMRPERTIDGSGLDASDLHSTDAETMWLTVMGDAQPWIQYAFDRVHGLDKMLVWNSNQAIEPMLGFGVKGVTVEVSVDGEAWTALGEFELAQAAGLAGYEANTTVDFAGTTAKFVRLAIASNWGVLPQYGLSEVRFFQIPKAARNPSPADGAAAVQPMVTLSWRAGREADSHQVFLGTEADNLALVGTVDEAAYEADLALSQTYFWKVVEVNAAETPSEWEGPVWSFTTDDSVIVDDFESYTDDMDAEETVFHAWIDGWDVPTNGSIVGHGEAPFAERTTVYAGAQSMPFAYNNLTGATYSEAIRTFAPAQDWTKYGLKTLSLYFHGAAENAGTGRLYIKINDTKVLYAGTADLTTADWTQWTVDLASTGANLANVTKMAVGVEGSGAAGSLFIDEIRLLPAAGN